MANILCGPSLLALNQPKTLPFVTDQFLHAVQGTRDAIKDIILSGKYATFTYPDGREIRLGTFFMSCCQTIHGYNQRADHPSMDHTGPHKGLTRHEIDLTEVVHIGSAHHLI